MKFNSQICTSRSQSERLLALGLKKETADCIWCEVLTLTKGNPIQWHLLAEHINKHDDKHIPAWSLHRLIEMMPNKIRKCDSSASLIASNEKVQYYFHDVEYSDYLTGVGRWKSGNIYDNIIDCIEWLIQEGYFYKEYLEEL